MFRFTVRDLLWLTLIVAVGLGWLVREYQVRDEVVASRGQVTKWRTAFGGLEGLVAHAGWTVTWDLGAERILISKGTEPGAFTYGGFFEEPSNPAEWEAFLDRIAVRKDND